MAETLSYLQLTQLLATNLDQVSSPLRSHTFSMTLRKAKTMMKGWFRITRQQCKASDTVPETHCTSTEGFDRRSPKMRLINVLFLRTISEIKLKRTDTTLDLSQKACSTYWLAHHEWLELRVQGRTYKES